jgi:hypothetical protein
MTNQSQSDAYEESVECLSHLVPVPLGSTLTGEEGSEASGAEGASGIGVFMLVSPR